MTVLSRVSGSANRYALFCRRMTCCLLQALSIGSRFQALMEDEIPDLRRAAVILRLELRNARKESCYLVGVINPEAELYGF